MNHEDALLGFIVCISHLVGFWGSGSHRDSHGQGLWHPVDRRERGKWVHKVHPSSQIHFTSCCEDLPASWWVIVLGRDDVEKRWRTPVFF